MGAIAEFVRSLPNYQCLICGGDRATHQFSVLGGPDGWLCEVHKDDPVCFNGTLYGNNQRR